MSDDAGRTFISRWSRRKSEARAAERAQAAPAAEQDAAAAVVRVDGTSPAPAGPGEVPPEGAPRAELPDPESLRGLESDYREFLRPEVDEGLRRTALKKLFADPHFNVMDGLDVYIDDYSKPDPIPAALLRTMNQARGLKLFDDEESADKADVAASQQSQAAAPPPGPESSSPAGQLASTECPPATERPPEAPPVAPDLPKMG